MQGIGYFEVIQQPAGVYWYVSEEPNKLTQLYMAKAYGFAAHNYLAGDMFDELELFDKITVEKENGNLLTYVITGIKRYRAWSEYLYEDLDTHVMYSDVMLFDVIYNTPNRLVLQTCIEKDGNDFWGRLFVIATPDIERIGVK